MLTTERTTALRWLLVDIVCPLLLAVAIAVSWFLIPLDHGTEVTFLLLKLFPLIFAAMLATSLLLLELVDSPTDTSTKTPALEQAPDDGSDQPQSSRVSRSRVLAIVVSAAGAALVTFGTPSFPLLSLFKIHCVSFLTHPLYFHHRLVLEYSG